MSKKDKTQNKDKETVENQVENEVEEVVVEEEAAEQEENKEPTIEDLQNDIVEANNKYLRAKAELDNYRKRSQREFAEIRKNTKSSTIQEFLTVYDHFQMALQYSDGDLNMLKQGMDMISAEFGRTLDGLGATPVDAVGQEFNHDLHEAISQEASDEVPEGKVIRQMRCGFKMGDRLLRPATVVVSSGPAKEENSEKPAETADK